MRSLRAVDFLPLNQSWSTAGYLFLSGWMGVGCSLAAAKGSPLAPPRSGYGTKKEDPSRDVLVAYAENLYFASVARNRTRGPRMASGDFTIKPHTHPSIWGNPSLLNVKAS